jgi:hypothetical protein
MFTENIMDVKGEPFSLRTVNVFTNLTIGFGDK